MPPSEWTTPECVLRYLDHADRFPHRAEGESVLLEHIPDDARRVLDLGTGDGRLLALLQRHRPQIVGVGLDFSEVMLDAARKRFADDERVTLIKHDLAEPLPKLEHFDAVISSFAIHHLAHNRKLSLYDEIFDLLEPGGVFANFEHVASATHHLHLKFFQAIEEPIENEDPSDCLLDVQTQLEWLRTLGFDDVDCYWKWLEMALLVGVKPPRDALPRDQFHSSAQHSTTAHQPCRPRIELFEGCWLRPLEESDADELHALVKANRDYLARWMPWAAGQTPEDTRAFIQRASEQLVTNGGFQTAVIEEGRIIGVVGFHDVSWQRRSTSIGYWLAESAQGRGIMSRAVRALIDHAFGTWRLHRVEIRVALDNTSSRAIPQRLGLAREGLAREAERIGGSYIDEVIYAILAQEWDEDR